MRIRVFIIDFMKYLCYNESVTAAFWTVVNL